mmetsp:Transcript_9705/g.29231  ORF Transcript_9705/g.29231 Transcript_9705/m.29231 type:complete len:314 (-) Transcript_9705:939-1880(-)
MSLSWAATAAVTRMAAGPSPPPPSSSAPGRSHTLSSLSAPPLTANLGPRLDKATALTDAICPSPIPRQRPPGSCQRRMVLSFDPVSSSVPCGAPLAETGGCSSTSMPSTMPLWPSSDRVHPRASVSKRRMAGLLVVTARWVGASRGPTNRMSVTSSLLPTSWRTRASGGPASSPAFCGWKSWKRQSPVAATTPDPPGSRAAHVSSPPAGRPPGCSACSYRQRPVSDRHARRRPRSPAVTKLTAFLPALAAGKSAPAGSASTPSTASCTGTVAMAVPERRSHTRAVLSRLPLTTVHPSVASDSEVTALRCPWST